MSQSKERKELKSPQKLAKSMDKARYHIPIVKDAAAVIRRRVLRLFVVAKYPSSIIGGHFVAIRLCLDVAQCPARVILDGFFHRFSFLIGSVPFEKIPCINFASDVI